MTLGGTTAVLLAVLEPGLTRSRLEAALDLLGYPRGHLAQSMDDGLLRIVDQRVEVCDAAVGRRCLGSAGERARRVAHLALACGESDTDLREAGALLHRLSQQLDTPGRRTPLTGRERHVAELAATGATSREIAAAVCLSPKTVEHHLTRIYRKVGVRSKAELAWSFGQVAR